MTTSLYTIVSRNRELLTPEAFVYFKYFIKSSPEETLSNASVSEILKCVSEKIPISLLQLNNNINPETYEIIKQTVIYLKQRDIQKELKKLKSEEEEVNRLKELVKIERELIKNAEELKKRHQALQLRLLGYVSNRVQVVPKFREYDAYTTAPPHKHKTKPNECRHCHV